MIRYSYRAMDHYQLIDMLTKLVMEQVPILERELALNQLDAQRCPRCKRIMEHITNGQMCNGCLAESK